MKKFEIWGFEWITERFGNPIPSRLIIAAKHKVNNTLITASYDKQEVEMFLCSLDTVISIDDLNKELISDLLEYYIHD